jgi:hypothetical protein
MTPENFCYWLQGYFDLQETGLTFSDKQMGEVKNHLKLVFKKETPRIYKPTTFNHQEWEEQAGKVLSDAKDCEIQRGSDEKFYMILEDDGIERTC